MGHASEKRVFLPQTGEDYRNLRTAASRRPLRCGQRPVLADVVEKVLN
jgi:hypothetical protein